MLLNTDCNQGSKHCIASSLRIKEYLSECKNSWLVISGRWICHDKTPSILEAMPVVVLGDIDELAPTSLSEPDTLSETLLPIDPKSFEY
jgi:hypothetical protein